MKTDAETVKVLRKTQEENDMIFSRIKEVSVTNSSRGRLLRNLISEKIETRETAKMLDIKNDLDHN